MANISALSEADIRKMLEGMVGDEFAKQITTGNVTIAGQLVRQDLADVIALGAPNMPPLVKRFSRIIGKGAAHQWYRLTAQQYLGNMYIGGTQPPAAFFARGGLPVSVFPNYQLVSAPYKNVGELVTVPFMTQDEGASFVDVRAHQKLVRTIATRQAEEWCICNGNAMAAANQFDGLGVQVLRTVAMGAGTLALFYAIAQSCREVYEWGGQSRCVVYKPAAHQWMINQVLTYLVRGFGANPNGAGNILGGTVSGFALDSWDFGWGKVDLIPERYLEQDSYGWPVYVLDDQSPDMLQNGNIIKMADLHALDMVELGLLASAWRDLIYETTVFCIAVPDFQRRITGLNDAFLNAQLAQTLAG